MEKCMDREYFILRMEIFMKDNMKMINDMDLEQCSGKTVK